MSPQVYKDLVDGFHIKVEVLGKHVWYDELFQTKRTQVKVRVQETAHGYRKGEVINCAFRDLFCIAGHRRDSGRIIGVSPDLTGLKEIGS